MTKNVLTLGLPPSLANSTPNPAFPAMTLGGSGTPVNGCSTATANVDFASFGGGCTAQDVFYSRNFNVTASRFLGRNSLKAGFEFRTIHDAGTPPSGPTSLGFTDVFTRKTPGSPTVGTGSDIATMLLGYPTSGQMSVVTSFDDAVRYYAGFVQDDFRITPKLTLNIGLGLEHESGVQEASNKLIVGPRIGR